MDEERIQLAIDIFNDGQGLTGSECAAAMKQALEAADEDSLKRLRAEYLEGDDAGD